MRHDLQCACVAWLLTALLGMTRIPGGCVMRPSLYAELPNLRKGQHDLWAVLGVERPVNPPGPDWIAKARRAALALSLRLHPDRNPHPQATAAQSLVNEAREKFSDRTTAMAYAQEVRQRASQVLAQERKKKRNRRH